jgi:hypothetical protein
MKELEYKLRVQKCDAGLRLGLAAIKWVSICVIAWRLGLAVEALAGKATLADFSVFLIADLKANKVFSHIIMAALGLGGITYGARERRLRRKAIKQSGGRIAGLEKRLDPNRTSSGLMIDGRSRPEDEP